MSPSSFSFPTAIAFGPGARKQVAAHLREQGLQEAADEAGCSLRTMFRYVEKYRQP